MDHLDNQIAWYDRKSAASQRWYKKLKLITMVSAVFVPVFSIADQGRAGAAALGIIIVIAEGLQQLNQFQTNWIAYRSTCEALKHEKFLYLAQAGPYESATSPLGLLAERIQGLVSQEHAKWVSAQQESGKSSTPGLPPQTTPKIR